MRPVITDSIADPRRSAFLKPTRPAPVLLLLVSLLGVFSGSADAEPPVRLRHVARLVAADVSAGDQLGYAMALDRDTLVVSAAMADVNGSNSGALYVYVRSGQAWSQQAKLLASDGAAGDQLGSSLVVEGDTIVAGASGDDSSRGSAYVFTRSGTTWTQEAKLVASDGLANDYFGTFVGLAGDTVVVGAPGADQAFTDAGSAYVFTRSGTSWTQRAELTAGDAAASDEFGAGLAIDGGTIAVSSPYDDDRGSDSGSLYVYTGSGASWSQQAKLTASDGAAGDQLGAYSVVVQRNTLVAGSHRDDDKGTDSGSAYVFTRSGSTWSQQAKLTASDGQAGDRFGNDVDLDAHTLTVGAAKDDDRGVDSGSFYVFRWNGSTWAQHTKVTSPDGAAGDEFGWPTAVSGHVIASGAFLDDSPLTDGGSLNVWHLSSFTAETHNPSNTFSAAAEFGWAETGTGSTPINNSSTGNGQTARLADVGAVPYVLWREHDGTNWEMRVSRYDSGTDTWVQVVGGASPINVDSTRNADGGDIAVVGGVVHVAWTETNGTTLQVRAKRLSADGLSWEPVAGGSSANFNTSKTAYTPSIADVGGTLWMTWWELDGDKIRAARLSADGTTWEHIGGILNVDSTKRAFVPRIASVSGVPWIAWVERTTTNASPQVVRVAKLNAAGTGFEHVGGPVEITSGADTRAPDITAIGGVPWVSWSEKNGTPFQVRVARLNDAGTGWTVVGGVLNLDSTRSVDYTDIADIGGVAYVSFPEPNSSSVNQVRATRLLSDGTWDRALVNRSANVDPAQPALRPNVLAVGGEPHVAFHERYDSVNNRYQIQVALW